MSRYIFTVFCSSYYQAVILQERISKIQLKTILMTKIDQNNTNLNQNYSHVVNCLVDVQKPTYMKYAIKGKLNKSNILDFYPVTTEEQIYNC